MSKLNIKKGDNIRTSQFPWAGESFVVEGIQEVKPNRFIFCRNLKTNQYVNLVENFCILPKRNGFTTFKNIQVIKLAKIGNKEAIKEYVRRFKKMPKFK